MTPPVSLHNLPPHAQPHAHVLRPAQDQPQTTAREVLLPARPGAGPHAPHPRRRHAPRRAPQGGIKVFCRDAGGIASTDLALSFLDVSETGARLLIRSPLDAGQESEIVLLGQYRLRPTRVQAEVVWTGRTAEGAWCVGVQFRRRLTHAEWLAC